MIIINYCYRLVTGVDGFVCTDGDREELSGELEDGLVLEDDGAATDSGSLNAKTILTCHIVARRNLKGRNVKLFFLTRTVPEKDTFINMAKMLISSLLRPAVYACIYYITVCNEPASSKVGYLI